MSEVLDRLIIGGARVTTDKGRLDPPNLYSQLDNYNYSEGCLEELFNVVRPNKKKS